VRRCSGHPSEMPPLGDPLVAPCIVDIVAYHHGQSRTEHMPSLCPEILTRTCRLRRRNVAAGLSPLNRTMMVQSVL